MAEFASEPSGTAPSATDPGPVSGRTDALRAQHGPAPTLKACCDGLVDAGVVGDQTRAALRRVVDLHQPETVDVDGACTRYGDEPGSGCCGACDLTETVVSCTCGVGIDVQPCPTLAVIGDELGVVLDEDAAPALLAGLLREHLDGLAAETAPQVWLPGDTVPAGVVVTDGSWTSSVAHAYRPSVAVVEVLIPDLAAVVAAEEARRAAGGAS